MTPPRARSWAAPPEPRAGAVLGSVGRGAGAGAAAGAAGGLVRGLFRGREPTPVYRRFVERCLSDKGYEVIGWE